MSACIACLAAPQPRASLSYKTTTVIAVITAMTFAASGAAPTTLYQRYQEVFGLTPFVLTIIFGAYVLSLLAALLTVGSLSDYVGRRPAILAALALNVAAMLMFISADSAATLMPPASCRVSPPASPPQRSVPRSWTPTAVAGRY
jgi:MFS family permease